MTKWKSQRVGKNESSSIVSRVDTFVREREVLALTFVVLGALLIRLNIMFAFHTYVFLDEKSMGAEMGWIARNLAEGRGFVVSGPSETVYHAWMAPLFPFILSGIFSVFGSYSLPSAVAILTMQSIVSSLIVIPIYFISKRLYDYKVAFIAIGLWAFHPGSIIYAVKHVWNSSFTALGLTLAFLLLLRLPHSTRPKECALIIGLLIGLTALSDPTVLSFGLVAVLWLLWRSRADLARATIQIALIAFATALVIAPWIARNHRIFHEFVPIKSTFGVNLWQGNHEFNINQPTAGIGFWNRVEERFTGEEIEYLLSINEVERAEYFQKKAIQFISASPSTFFKYTVWRIYLFWRHFAFRIDGMYLLPFYLLIVVGFIMSRRQRTDTTLFLLLFAVFPIPYYLTIADTYRYRFPLEGLLLIPLAYSVCCVPVLACRAFGTVSRRFRSQT